jgi:hypothetical protein
MRIKNTDFSKPRLSEFSRMRKINHQDQKQLLALHRSEEIVGLKIFLPAAAYWDRTFIDVEALVFSQTASLKLFEEKSRYTIFP